MGIGKIKNAQMKIQQMVFMIIAVFLFFIFVGLFLINFQLKDIKKNVNTLNRDKTIASLSTIANMPEINCGSGRSLCLDEDKLRIMSGEIGKTYESFWPVASVKVYKIYPKIETELKCPALNCNYYLMYDNGQSNRQEYSTYVNLCEKTRSNGYVLDKCAIAKLVVGMNVK